MRRLLKAIFAILAVFVIILVILGAIFFLDLAAYTVTGTRTLAPSGASIGSALVLYNPGLSGASTVIAEKVAAQLQTISYNVTLAGIKSSSAATTSGYDIVVIGGPVYAESLTASLRDVLTNLNVDETTNVGVYGSGQGATSSQDVAQIRNSVAALKEGPLEDAVVIKIGANEDLNVRVADFVNQLIK